MSNKTQPEKDALLLAELNHLYVVENKPKETVLKELGLSEHKFRQLKKLGNIHKIKPRQFKSDILKRTTIAEIKEFFASHTAEETARHFDITLQNLKDFMDAYEFRHSDEEKAILRSETCSKLYGVPCVLQREDVQEASHSAAAVSKMLERQKQSNLAKYGVAWTPQRSDVKEKIAATNIKKYGNAGGWQTTADGRLKLHHIHSSQRYKDKEFKAKKRNASFNSSSQEECLLHELSDIFGKSNIKYQYKDSRYRFACDFYISSLDLFIELNLHWTHGDRPFDRDSQSSIKRLSELLRRSHESKFYANAVTTWTVRDPAKINAVKENKLDYISIYPKTIIFFKAGVSRAEIPCDAIHNIKQVASILKSELSSAIPATAI